MRFLNELNGTPVQLDKLLDSGMPNEFIRAEGKVPVFKLEAS